MSFKDKLKAARLPEDVVPVCLRGDLTADFEKLQKQLETLGASRSGMEDAGQAALLEQMADIRQQMQEATEQFRLRALARPAFRELLAQYPPKRNEAGEVENVLDLRAGCDLATFLPALFRRSVVEPELDDEDWEQLEAVLTDRQFEELCDAAWNVNRDEVKPVPFSRAELRTSRTSGSE